VAKKSMIARDTKRARVASKYKVKRLSIKSIIKNKKSDHKDLDAAILALQKLPRDASPSRQQRRCCVTGRPHSVYRKFGLSRNKLREMVMWGNVPGVFKSSW